MWILIPILALSIPLLAIWTSHQKEMLNLQHRRSQEAGSQTQIALEALRDEVRALRDTTMQYDMSFDAALQSMERRVATMERRILQIEAQPAEVQTQNRA